MLYPESKDKSLLCKRFQHNLNMSTLFVGLLLMNLCDFKCLNMYTYGCWIAYLSLISILIRCMHVMIGG